MRVLPSADERPLLDVAEALIFMPMSERSLRRALEPGGDLEGLAFRVGRRLFVKVAALRATLGLDDEGAVAP